MRSVLLAALALVSTPFLQAQAPAPSLQDLKNATYSGFRDVTSPVTLMAGKWESPTVRRSVTFVGELYATGDLNDDGVIDAAVFLAESTAGSGERIYLAIVTTASGQLQNIATKLIGPNVKVRRLRIVDRTIVTDVLQVGPDDAMCCPSDLVTRSFVLKGTSLEELPRISTGKLTMDATGNVDWILRRWTAADPSPMEPRVTLRYHEGQAIGFAGCNRYTVRVAGGDIPGAVEIGTPTSTKMACPDAAMAVETRFLRQLQAVTNFTFIAGQLALSYSLGGQVNTMIFDAATSAGR